MKTSFKQFTSDFEYRDNQKVWVSATIKLNDWLAANSAVYVKNWQTTATGRDHQLTIVVEYLED